MDGFIEQNYYNGAGKAKQGALNEDQYPRWQMQSLLPSITVNSKTNIEEDKQNKSQAFYYQFFFSFFRLGDSSLVSFNNRLLNKSRCDYFQMNKGGDSYNLNMSNIQEISVDSDKDQSSQFEIHPIKNNINHTKDLNTIGEEQNEGGETSTPARPTIGQEPTVGEESSQNPESTEAKQDKEKACWKSRRFVVLLTIGLILTATLVIWASVNAAKGPTKTYRTRKSFTIPTQGFRAARIVGESLVMTDQVRFGPGKQLQIIVMKTGGEKASETIGRALQEKEKSQTTVTIRDSQTDTLISVTSKQLDIKMVVNPTALLQYVLNAQIEQDPDTDYQHAPSQNLKSSQQPPTETPLQSQSQLPNHPVLTYNFYQYDELLEQELKSTLKSINKEVVVSNQATVDLKYDSASQTYRIEEQPPLSDEKKNSSASFANSASVPRISNFIDEDEVTKASNVLLESILRSAKIFFQQSLDQIQEASGIVLPQSDKTLGETSIYKDQPQDLLKLCQNLDEQTLRCDTGILSSTLLQVSDPEFHVDSKSNIVVFIDK